LVVVVPVEAVPADVGEAGLPATERGLQVAQPERPDVPLAGALVEADVLELEHHVDLAPIGRGELAGLFHRDTRHLADRQQRTVEDSGIELVEELVDAWPADVER
jgi:hypothetical protein